MKRQRSGENWSMGGTGRTTIVVIDAKDEKPVPEGAKVVPFGFSRALAPVDNGELDLPQGWEGSD